MSGYDGDDGVSKRLNILKGESKQTYKKNFRQVKQIIVADLKSNLLVMSLKKMNLIYKKIL